MLRINQSYYPKVISYKNITKYRNVPTVKSYIMKDILSKYKMTKCTSCIISLTKEQLENCRLVARNNILYFNDGITPVDSVKFSRDGSYNFVLSDKGEFYAHTCLKNVFNHSSFFDCGPVACSGEIIIQNGKVVGINNRSGHYKPESIHLMQAVVTLHHMNVLSPNCEVTLFGDRSFSANEFLTKLSKLDELPGRNEIVMNIINQA